MHRLNLPMLIKFAAGLGLEKSVIGTALKSAGFTGFNPEKWEEMKAAIILYASERHMETFDHQPAIS